MTAGENEHQIGWEGRRRRRKGGKQASCSAEALRPCFPSLGPYFGVGSPEGFCRYCSVLGELQILDYAVMPFVFAVIGEGLYHWTSTTLLSNAICGTLRAAPQEAAPAFNLMNERVEVPAVWLGREPCLSTLFLLSLHTCTTSLGRAPPCPQTAASTEARAVHCEGTNGCRRHADK